jgi:hypothetical protein
MYLHIEALLFILLIRIYEGIYGSVDRSCYSHGLDQISNSRMNIMVRVVHVVIVSAFVLQLSCEIKGFKAKKQCQILTWPKGVV